MLKLIRLLCCSVVAALSVAANAAPGTCNPLSGVSIIGIEAAATSDRFDDGHFYYEYSLLSCTGGQITQWNSTNLEGTPYAMYQATQTTANMRRLYSSGCGSHIIVLHDNYKGTLNGVGPNPASIPGMLFLNEPHSKCSNGSGSSGDPTVAVNNACPACSLNGQPGFGDPINAGTGNHFQKQIDWVSASASPLKLIRYYNSLDISGNMGKGWHHEYEESLLQRDSYLPVPVYDKASSVTLWDGSPTAFGGIFSGNPSPSIPASIPQGNDPSNGQIPASPMMQLILNDGRVIGFAIGGGADKQGLGYNLVASGANWTLSDPNDTVKTFGSTANGQVGQLQSIRYRNGRTITIAYTNGRIDTVTDNFSYQLKYSYDAQGRVASVTVPGGRNFQYVYNDSYGNLNAVTGPDNLNRQYIYGNSTYKNLLTSIVDENGSTYASWSFDTQGRATSSQLGAGANSITVGYNSLGQSTVTEAAGAIRNVSMQIIKNRMLITSMNETCTGCTSRTIQFTYDDNGNITRKVDYNGNVTTYVIDLARNLETSRTEASGTPQARTITTTWHPTWHLIKTLTEPGRVTTYDWDNTTANLNSKTIAADGKTRVWAWTYFDNGLVKTATDPDGKVTSYTYDTAGNVATITNPLAQITTFNRYDANGNVLEMTGADGLKTLFSYDLRNRLKTRQVGTAQTSYDYWPNGLLKQATLPDGLAINYLYDTAQRLSEVNDNRGNRVTYRLNNLGQPEQVDRIDPDGTLTVGLSQVQQSQVPANAVVKAQ